MNGILTTSWDDGARTDIRLAGRLAAHRIPATFYLSRQGERPVMGAGETRTLLDMGFEVGAHTLTHADIPRCTAERARDEVFGSKQWIEQTTGRPCRMFCFPKGKFGLRDARLVNEAGFIGMRTVELLSTEWPVRREGVLVMPTSVQTVSLSPARLARNLVRRGQWRRLAGCAVRGIGHGDWPRTAIRLAEEARARGGVFHLWGHSWMIDRLGLWGLLDDVLAHLAGLFPPSEMATNGQVCEMAAARNRESGRE